MLHNYSQSECFSSFHLLLSDGLLILHVLIIILSYHHVPYHHDSISSSYNHCENLIGHIRLTLNMNTAPITHQSSQWHMQSNGIRLIQSLLA